MDSTFSVFLRTGVKAASSEGRHEEGIRFHLETKHEGIAGSTAQALEVTRLTGMTISTKSGVISADTAGLEAAQCIVAFRGVTGLVCNMRMVV